MSEVTETEEIAPEVEELAGAPAPTVETKQEMWARLAEAKDEAITTEDVAGTKPAEEGAKSDRELVAPSIREFIRAQKVVEPSPLETEIAELRGALDGLRAEGTPENPQTPEQQVLAKLEALEARESERQDAEKAAREEEDQNSRIRAMKDGVVENIRSRKEDYPGLLALEQEETAFNALVGRLQEGEDTSEDEVASEIEEGLKEVYEKLHKVYGISKDPTPASEPTTLTNTLVADDVPVDYTTLVDKKAAMKALWAKHTH
jgi:hypothetical protein